MSTVGVIGLGKLGLPLAAVLAEEGYDVIGCDRISGHVNALMDRTFRSNEPGLMSMLEMFRASLQFTTNIGALVPATDMCFIVVPTPSSPDQPEFSLKYVIEAIHDVTKAVNAERKRDYVIVLVSTVMPGACERVLWPMIESMSAAAYTPQLVYNPEFIALGNVIHGMRHPDLILIGGKDESAMRKVANTVVGLTRTCVPDLRLMGWTNAELTKLCINAGLGWKITLANLISTACEMFPGADSDVVSRAVGADTRIGAKYLSGGMGFGGPCLPRDIEALKFVLSQSQSRSAVWTKSLLDDVTGFNESRVMSVTDHIVSRVPLPGPIAVIGMAYRDGTPVLEASQPLEIAMDLHKLGFKVHVCDSEIGSSSLAAGSLDQFLWFDSAKDCIAGCRGIVLPKWTAQAEELRYLVLPSPCVIVDCWRQLPAIIGAREGITYIPFGRSL